MSRIPVIKKFGKAGGIAYKSRLFRPSFFSGNAKLENREKMKQSKTQRNGRHSISPRIRDGRDERGNKKRSFDCLRAATNDCAEVRGTDVSAQTVHRLLAQTERQSVADGRIPVADQ